MAQFKGNDICKDTESKILGKHALLEHQSKKCRDGKINVRQVDFRAKNSPRVKRDIL